MPPSNSKHRAITLIAWCMTVSGLNIISPSYALKRPRTALNYRNDEKNEELLWDASSVINQPAVTMIGQVLKDKYVVEREIPVASAKCELYEVFLVEDVWRENPLIVKLSEKADNIEAEYQVYSIIASKLYPEEQDLFVEIYDKIDEAHLVRGKSALVMEKGEDNLRFHLQRHGRLQREELRVAMERVIRVVQALHEKGMIWTEIKAENFIVKDDGRIKGIDLESVIYQQNFLQMYTAESVPPEFPIDDLHMRVPEMQPEYSFDIWGLGIVLFEMATGKPFYDGGLTNLEFIKEKLRHTDEIGPFVDRKLWEVDPLARKVIKQCLNIDPSTRSSCQELLRDPYFSSFTQQLAKSKRPESAVRATNAMTNLQQIADIEHRDGNSQRNQMEGRQNGVLDLNLSERLGAVLDAIDSCAQENPVVAKAFLDLQPWKERSEDDHNEDEKAFLRDQHGLTKSLEAVLDAINVVAKSDPAVARDFLYILHQSPAPQVI